MTTQDYKEEEKFGRYIYKIRGLMNLKRYQNLFLFKQRSVAEHEWSVAKIAQGLAYIEKRHGNPVNMGVLLQKAISHDDPELFSGDILSHTKRRTKKMEQAVEEIEKIIFADEFSKMLPDSWQSDFENFVLRAKDETIEGLIICASDIIDTIFEAIEEIKLGNTEYFKDEVLVRSTKKLMTIELDSVRDFFKYVIPNLGLDVREYFGDEVETFIESL